MSDPILKPFRKLIPPLSGIDFSPIFAIICIQAIIIFFQSIKPYYL
jgi:YggT family protein